MGFVRDLGERGLFGLAGSALSKKKAAAVAPPPRPSMISNIPMERPTSMIGTRRGGY